MSELAKTRRPIIYATDEGYDEPHTNPSTRRYKTQPQPQRPLADRVPSRASRPAVRTAPVSDDVYAVYERNSDEATMVDPVYVQRQRSPLSRQTTNVYFPPRAADSRPMSQRTHYPEYHVRGRRDGAWVRSSVSADADVFEESEDLGGQISRYNRLQRRRKLTPGQMVVLQWFCKIVLAALLLYCLGSLAFTWYMDLIGDPATYGPEHGNVVTLIDRQQIDYLQGINNRGQTEIIEIPVNHPDTSKIYLGPSGGPTDANVKLELKDMNHDGHTDIIEHVEPEGFRWLFTPPSSSDFIFLNTGNGQFKLQPPNQEGE